jgi:hypothetical protein
VFSNDPTVKGKGSMAKQAKRSKWFKFVERWHDLHERRAKLDYETASLAAEIRGEFPAGASGDLQFRQWCVRNLDVYGGTAAMLLRAVKVHDIFDESDWYDLGGWQSLQFLSTLRTAGRRKVLNACRRRVQELRDKKGKRRHIGYTTVRTMCYALGVQQDNRIGGRPNRLAVEESLGFCRNWIKTLYTNYENLPKPPKAVQSALGGTKLSQIAAAAKAG